MNGIPAISAAILIVSSVLIVGGLLVQIVSWLIIIILTLAGDKSRAGDKSFYNTLLWNVIPGGLIALAIGGVTFLFGFFSPLLLR